MDTKIIDNVLSLLKGQNTDVVSLNGSQVCKP